MASHRQASDEIIQFLEDFQGTSPDLPISVVGHWQEAMAICKKTKPNWSKAADFCNCIATVLNGLRGSGGDLGQLEKSQGQISILLGAISLGQKDWSAASYYFEQGARRLRQWGHTSLESLAYFGRALTHKQEENWPGALEAAQKALDAIHGLPVPDKSMHTKHLQKRIEEGIRSIGEVSARVIAKQPPSRRPTPSRSMSSPPLPIPIVSNIAAGLGVIVEENIENYLLLDDDRRNDVDFGVRVVGESMKGDGILPGDIALIRQQPIVEMGEIAAVVVTTPTGSEGVLKRYHLAYEERPSMFHWFLKSSNPASEHLVVIPSGADIIAIKAIYENAIRSGRIRNPIEYYEDAELIIAGKYVGSVKSIPISSDISAFTAGPGRIGDENTEGFISLDVSYRTMVDFGVRVIGDSMKGDGILPGNIALIRQQPVVGEGEIAALVITTSTGREGVLKRYYPEESEGLQHWLLKSSNPVAKDLVVIPPHTDVDQIRNLYAREIQSDRVEFYEDAELEVVGKYVECFEEESFSVPVISTIDRVKQPSVKTAVESLGGYAEVEILAGRIAETVSERLTGATHQLAEANYRYYDELKGMIRKLPFAGIEVLDNFEGFVIAEIPDARKETGQAPNKDRYILHGAQKKHEIHISIQSVEPLGATDSVVEIIRIIDGEDVEYVNFVARLDCNTLDFEQAEFTISVPSRYAKPSIPKKVVSITGERGIHNLFIHISQKNTLVQVLFIELEIR